MIGKGWTKPDTTRFSSANTDNGLLSHRQAVRLPGPQTLGIAWHHLTAGCGPVFIDAARHLTPHFAGQGLAPWLTGAGAAHAQHIGPQGFGECHGHVPARRFVGLAPVKRHPEMGAAGAALLTVQIDRHDEVGHE